MKLNALTRRAVFLGFAAVSISLLPGVGAAEPVKALVHKSASCGCCGKWIDRLKAAGYEVEAVNEPDMKSVKARLGMPSELASCHTAEIGGYVVEGHAPVAAIDRLLKEKPKARGLAVPGMPAGSPGMEMGGEEDLYEVILFDEKGGRSSYGAFKGGAAQ